MNRNVLDDTLLLYDLDEGCIGIIFYVFMTWMRDVLDDKLHYTTWMSDVSGCLG